MDKLAQFGEMTAKFSSLADFVTVYISEAHPSEEANFTGNIDIAQHKVPYLCRTQNVSSLQRDHFRTLRRELRRLRFCWTTRRRRITTTSWWT